MQELHDALDDDTETFADLINPGDFNLSDLGQELPPPPPDMLMKTSTHGAKYLSTEELPKEDTESKSKIIRLTKTGTKVVSSVNQRPQNSFLKCCGLVDIFSFMIFLCNIRKGSC